MPELNALRELGARIVPPPLDRLRETARRRQRRSRLAAVAGSAAAAAAVATTAVMTSPVDAPDPGSTDRPRPAESETRPLTYADGRTIHYGRQSVDAGGKVVELDLTDQGVVFRTADGRIGFTGGVSVVELGSLGDLGPAYDGDFWPLLMHDGWLVSAHSGSRVAWFEFPRLGEPEVVVFDTATLQEVSRDAVTLDPGGRAIPALVSEGAVYWYLDPSSDREAVDTDVVRYDPVTSAQTRVSHEDVQRDLRSDSPERTVLIGEDGAAPQVTDGTDRNFAIERGRVTPMGEGPPVPATDGLTGRRFAFDAPPGYPPQVAAYLTQWRDDDTIVLLSAQAGGHDLLECRVSTGACEVVLSGPASIVVPEVG